jgi:hypothetical protein
MENHLQIGVAMRNTKNKIMMDYLTAWAIGTITQGYRKNPLEEMAFRHQARFETGEKPYNVVKEITAEISVWPDSIFNIRKIA